MKYTLIGKSGISRITHGCMELGGGPWDVREDKENIALLNTALEHGITTFDTAESYGKGHSEEVVGQALHAVRDKVVLCTKVSKEHLHKNDVIAACEGSLRRLNTEYIDLYYIHWPNAEIDIGETMEAFLTLKEQGKIRAIGVSNFSVQQMQYAMRYAPLDALQPEYNLLTRGIEKDVLPFCAQNSISVMTYNSIAKGILSGAFHFYGAQVTDFRTAKPLFQPEALALELPPPDLIVAEGGNLTQCSAISRMFGRKRCLAHLHGQTTCTPVMDDIYGGVLALSDFIREDYLQSSTLDPQRAYILHNCIDTARFCPGPASKTLRAQLGFTDEDFVVLYCGRLDPDKGIHKLMEAIAALHEPHIKLLIVGSPFFARTQQSAFQRKLEQQAKSLGNRVQFTGYIPNEDLPDYYRLADLCCVPTLVEEAAGLVAVEAMACGRPVLATRSGGMPEYLAGSQAVLVERGDTVTDQLAWSIRMLYEHPALCTEMGAAGAARGREFSTAHYYEEFVRIVRDVTENGGAQ